MRERRTGAALSRPLTDRGLRSRVALKRFLYTVLGLRQSLMVALGKEQPLVRFTVEADPPSVYVVYRLRRDAVESLPATLGLARGMTPAPIRCLAEDQPDHLLVLNYYRVSGLSSGLRAEWSTFISDADGIPRYLVFDACSNEFSVDPIEIVTRRRPVVHARDGATITSVIGEPASTYECTIDLPADEAAHRVTTSSEWANANDFIYWTNGIRDRTFYDAGMHDPAIQRVPDDAVTIVDNTPWAAIVEPAPMHVLVYEASIELTMSPWENVEDLRSRP